MTRNEYLDRLMNELKKQNSTDIEEIIMEYDQHFAFKMADGYTEEEVATRLEEPEALAKQFAPSGSVPSKRPGKIPVIIGLVFADIAYVSFLICLVLWSASLGIFAVAAAVEGISLIAKPLLPDGLIWIPYMPYIGALVMSIAFLALGVLFAVVTLYCFGLTAQINKAYMRWHKNAVSGEKYPPLPKHPMMSDNRRRGMRSATLVSLVVFGIFFVLAFMVLSASAGSFGFWHVWNWFV